MKQKLIEYREVCEDLEIFHRLEESYLENKSADSFVDVIQEMEEDTNSGVSDFAERELQHAADFFDLGIEVKVNTIDDSCDGWRQLKGEE